MGRISDEKQRTFNIDLSVNGKVRNLGGFTFDVFKSGGLHPKPAAVALYLGTISAFVSCQKKSKLVFGLSTAGPSGHILTSSQLSGSKKTAIAYNRAVASLTTEIACS